MSRDQGGDPPCWAHLELYEAAEGLERARTAFAASEWRDAYDALAGVERDMTLEPEDLERLATAAYLIGRDAESTAAWTRAHQAWFELGNEAAAVRCAFWLGFALVQRGDMAEGGGWLARAERIADDHELDAVERGYLLMPKGLMAMGSGEPDAALERFAEADTLARRFGDRDLSAMGTLGQGQAMLQKGRVSDGLALFDEAMVAVTAGETSPVVSGLVYCAVIDCCHRVCDLRRAVQWTAALDRWCESQPGLVPYRGQCMVHRAQVLQLRGKWERAVADVRTARRQLTDPPHPAVGMAHYQLGELERLRGNLAEAEDAYRQAHAAGREPQPGLALLRLAQGRTADAAGAIRSALDGETDRSSRVRLLAAAVEIELAAGRSDDAASAVEQLELLADGPTMLDAITERTRAAVLLHEGQPEAALAHLRRALHAWQELDAPYETGRVRVLLAVACEQLDDRDRAQMECALARHTFIELGAAPALEQLDELFGDNPPAEPHSHPDDRDGIITDRELEVLRLVATGSTNRDIGSALAISERTVERHLGNIFTKIGVTNRAAATAYAYVHRLL